MKFDFTTIYDRRGKDAMAVDAVEKIPTFQPNEGFDAIPMWEKIGGILLAVASW